MAEGFTLVQLRAFMAASTEGSFTAAAAVLGMTQPAASELVRRLEDAYGLPLFVRAGRRLRRTVAGDELLVWAGQILASADGADQSLRALRGLEGGTANFGVLRNASYYFLSDLAERFHLEHPGVQIRLIGQNSVEVAEAVRSGELEAGFAVLPLDTTGLEVTPLLDDEVLFASADPERLRAPMTFAGLAEAPLVLYDAHYGWNDPTRRQLAALAAAEGVQLEASIEVENVEAALDLVARGLGDTIVSRAVAASAGFPGGVSTVAFATPFHDTVALLRRERQALSPVTQRLVEMAVAMLLRG